MRYRFVSRVVSVAAFATVAALGACGKEIGDACVVPIDCSPNGDRICIDAIQTSAGTKQGYCTVQGCDYSTCPSEAACVRFFTGSFSNKPCDPLNPDHPTAPNVVCSLDELCAVEGHCVARSSEVRYCMRVCESDADCRADEGYECRDLARMKAHGGQPVLAPGVPIDEKAPKFCAAAPG